MELVRDVSDLDHLHVWNILACFQHVNEAMTSGTAGRQLRPPLRFSSPAKARRGEHALDACLTGKSVASRIVLFQSREVKMSVIQQEGSINESTQLIDAGLLGALGFNAVYLITGTRKCLIDSGTKAEAPYLVRKLKRLHAFPPDLIVLTHPHWDHTQGIPFMRKEALKMGKKIEVLASAEAIQPLQDCSFNDVFEIGSCEAIAQVTPLQDGDTIDLGSTSLRIHDVPGHCRGHIAIFDEKSEYLFAGDSVGNQYQDQLFMPTFMPPTWNTENYLSSLKKMEKIPFKALCRGHFGCTTGQDARAGFDKSLETFHLWWNFYERNASKLDDLDYLLARMKEEINPQPPRVALISLSRRVMMKLMPPQKIKGIIEKTLVRDYLKWLASAYRPYAMVRAQG
jgi:glyoxylase-like metal-dependent hydrolase (beta-lactamase superfamily II)